MKNSVDLVLVENKKRFGFRVFVAEWSWIVEKSFTDFVMMKGRLLQYFGKNQFKCPSCVRYEKELKDVKFPKGYFFWKKSKSMFALKGFMELLVSKAFHHGVKCRSCKGVVYDMVSTFLTKDAQCEMSVAKLRMVLKDRSDRCYLKMQSETLLRTKDAFSLVKSNSTVSDMSSEEHCLQTKKCTHEDAQDDFVDTVLSFRTENTNASLLKESASLEKENDSFPKQNKHKEAIWQPWEYDNPIL